MKTHQEQSAAISKACERLRDLGVSAWPILPDGSMPGADSAAAMAAKAWSGSGSGECQGHAFIAPFGSGPAACVRLAAGTTIAGVERAVLSVVDDQRQFRDLHTLVENFSQRLMQSYEETYSLFRTLRLVASSPDPVQQIRLVCANVQQVLPFAWVAVGFRDDPRIVGELRGRVFLVGAAPKQDEVEAAIQNKAAALLENEWTKVLVPGKSTVATLTNAEAVCDPISHDDTVIGLLIAGNKTNDNGEIASPEMQYLDAVAEFIGTFHENMARFSEQRAMSIGTLEALTAAIDAKDPYTRGHSERVAYLSREIALALDLSEAEAERVRISGLVHDVGKIGVPERVLCKAGKLTDEEFGLIKLHPETGHRILKGITLLEHALGGVLHHHERIDGRGYPHGLKGDAIPLTARIIGLADTFDAMSSNRAYRPAMPREKVLAEITRCAGTQLDPAVVAAFTKVNLQGYDELMSRQAVAAGVVFQQAA
ncbi:MAG: HD-GYP domain-containing protein [Phycisphaerales bacterium]|nr:HD-GYP domain-containing protein [Phycisphaerales bacterium]